MKQRKIKLDARGRPIKPNAPTQIQADLLAEIYASGATPSQVSQRLGWYRHYVSRILKSGDEGGIRRLQQIADAVGVKVKFVKVKRANRTTGDD